MKKLLPLVVLLFTGWALKAQSGCVASASLDVVINNCTSGMHIPGYQQRLILTPNPSDGHISFRFAREQKIEKAEIINAYGQVVIPHIENGLSSHSQISVEALPPGVYFIRIFSENKVYSEHFLRK